MLYLYVYIARSIYLVQLHSAYCSADRAVSTNHVVFAHPQIAETLNTTFECYCAKNCIILPCMLASPTD